MEKNIRLFFKEISKIDKSQIVSVKSFVRSKNNNKLVSISNLVEYNEEGKSPFLSRYNRQKAVTISAKLVNNYSLDEA